MLSFYHICMNSSIFTMNSNDTAYPALLRETAVPPSVLFYRGFMPSAGLPLLAIVGTRKATNEGKLLAKRISRECARKGFGIVSGLALGIDAAAHEGALAGDGYTLAVLANGLDEIYPRGHYGLAMRVLEAGGGIVSEYPKGTPALPHQFLERNRIIAGLCIATIVIEAPERSGAIATARNAAEEGREVFVFPGNPEHPNYRGCHTLIRKGARLVGGINDIFEDLNIETEKEENRGLFASNETMEKDGENEAQNAILKILAENKKSLSIDKLSHLTKLEPKIISRELAFLMLREKIEEQNGVFKIK